MAHDKQIFIYWDDELTNNKNLELFNMDNKNPDSFADFVDELTNSPSKVLLLFGKSKRFCTFKKKKMYSKKQIDKTLSCVCITDKNKIDRLLKMDSTQYTNLGINSTKAEKETVRKNSRYIYKTIKKIDNALGESFLRHQD